MQIGIDFGTTNSAVAHYQNGQLTPIIVDPTNEKPELLPSLIYITKEQETFVGYEAAQQYLERETGRPVRWERQYAGEIVMTVSTGGSAPIDVLQDIYAQADVAARGRFLQSIKTALRDPDYEGTRIFNRFYGIDELITIVLGSLKARAEAQFEQDCPSVILGRPVKFSDNPMIDNRAEEILYKAARLAGFDDIRFAAEPLAIAYLHHVNSQQRHTALVFDFGGGTLDFTVAELGGRPEPKILANHGVLVGGDDLDREMMRSLLKYFGKGTRLRSLPFPDEMLELLLSWQTMPELSRPQHMSEIRDFKTMSNQPQTLDALEALVTRNLGYKLFREIEQNKRRLSDSIVTKLDFVYPPAIQIHEAITRSQFEQMISAQVKAVKQGITEALEMAAVKPSQIDVVLRTGGSSLVPAFSRLLNSIFGEEKITEIEPLSSVVGGMAVIADQGVRPIPAFSQRYTHNLLHNVSAESGRSYEITRLHLGTRCYTDNTSVISRAPALLSALPMIRTSNVDSSATSDTFLRFMLDAPATVFVAYETNNARQFPRWLRTFEATPKQIVIEDDWSGVRLLHLYAKDFPAGEVVLGSTQADGYLGTGGMGYFVIVRAVV